LRGSAHNRTEDKAGLAKRQRQVELAEARDEPHVGARIALHAEPR
jgi:hypothetical protein